MFVFLKLIVSGVKLLCSAMLVPQCSGESAVCTYNPSALDPFPFGGPPRPAESSPRRAADSRWSSVLSWESIVHVCQPPLCRLPVPGHRPPFAVPVHMFSRSVLLLLPCP